MTAGSMLLTGKRAVITGASQGLGLAIARAFVRAGSGVLLCARTAADLEQAADQLRVETPGGVRIASMPTDVSSEAEVQKLVEAAERELGGVDVLVANAGVYGPKGSIDKVDWEAWTQAISINLNGTVLCCRLFLPLLRRSKRGKILLLSGGGATKPLPFLSAYAASKAAVVRFGETLAEELSEEGIDVNSIAPGALNTRLLDEVLAAGPEQVGGAFYKASLKQQQSGGTPLEKGADLCVHLASDAGDGITGKLISAVWDPWLEFDDHSDDLKKTDIYTLRRIVPADRGLRWGK